VTAAKTVKPKAPKKVVDWGAIEPHFRAGLLSLDELGKQYDCSGAAISKHAKKNGWSRDLKQRIAARAEAKVNEAAVKDQVKTDKSLNEKAVVDANAQLVYQIRMEHRQDIGRSRKLFQALLHELEQLTDHQDLYEEIADLYDQSGPDSSGKWKTDKANELYRKIISLGGRVDNGKKLVEMIEKLVKLEREAFGITGTEEGGKGGIEDLLRKLGEKGA
jgi:hypothetical protein